eukprot:3852777-Heterocapsa_arctica.AAC.1
MIICVRSSPHPDARHPARLKLRLLERSRFADEDRLSPLEQAPTVGMPVLVLVRRQAVDADL